MVIVRPSKIEGRAIAPPSKSYSHRALAISLLSQEKSTLNNVSLANDVRATVNAIEQMGAHLELRDKEHGIANMDVTPPFKPKVPPDVLYCGGSGTTIRFFASIASLTDMGYTVLTGNDSLRKRPMGPLLDAITQLGGWAISTRMNGLPPLVVKGGGLDGGVALIPGNMSSQFFSSLMISGSLSSSGVELIPKGELVSKPYLNMTAALLGMAGVEVNVESNRIMVKPSRPMGLSFTIPGDFGLAAPLMVAASITGGRLEVSGLNFDLPQADSLIMEVLKSFGVSVDIDHEGIVVSGKPVKPADLDLKDAPDLLPIAAVLASFAPGTSMIKGVSHARMKESDRISNMRRELSKAGVSVKETEDGLIIKGGHVKGGVKLNSWGDHRIFMALTVLSAGASEPCLIEGSEWVSDSYPNFLSDMRNLGLVLDG